jgi:RNA polymerase-binding transcription factor DksA
MAKNNKTKKSSGKPAPKKPVAKSSAKKEVKKAKPAAKKDLNKSKPKAKPAAKKEVKKVKPTSKPIAKKEVKKAKQTSKPIAKKEVKKAKPEIKKQEKKVVKEKEITKKLSVKEEKNKSKKLKEETKKIKPVDEELETEDLELEGGLLEGGLDVVESEVDDDDDDFEPDEPKRKGRKPKVKEVKKKYDSEDFVRKQVVKIDLSKSLLKKQPAEQPKPFVNTSDNRTRYSDKELAEFKELILKKIEEAQADYDLLKQTLSHADDHGTDDTSPSFKLLEDGSDVLSKEETAQLASRQEKYIVNLKNALVRIENKSYGVCRVTNKLIPKERLRSVPHATLGIDAKLNQHN